MNRRLNWKKEIAWLRRLATLAEKLRGGKHLAAAIRVHADSLERTGKTVVMS